MRRGLGGLAIHCRLPGVTVGRLRKRSFPVGLIKAGLRSLERRRVNGMY
jgi:hypothetical protein